MITAEYHNPGTRNWRKVVVDSDAGTATFYRCHHPNQFFKYHVDDEYTCRLDDVRGTCWRLILLAGGGHVWYYDVVTPAGRVMFHQAARGFEEVRAAIAAGLAPGAGLSWYQHYWVQLILYGAVGFGVALAAIPFLVGLPKNVVMGLILGSLFLLMLAFFILMRKEPMT